MSQGTARSLYPHHPNPNGAIAPYPDDKRCFRQYAKLKVYLFDVTKR
ncbi:MULTISPECIES: hypothetical protein [Oscillatoriales]|nr:hypothetical protein [Arthrospira platensis]MDF2213451.1 hypothetical protein [Arthrospira platensis NCB002]